MKLITFIQIVASVCVTAGKQEFVVNGNEFEVGISENEAGLEVHEDKYRLLRGNELADGNSESGEHMLGIIETETETEVAVEPDDEDETCGCNKSNEQYKQE